MILYITLCPIADATIRIHADGAWEAETSLYRHTRQECRQHHINHQTWWASRPSSPCDCQWSVPPWACPYCAQSCQCIHHGHQVLVTVSDLYHHEHALIVHSRVSVSIMAIKSLWLSVICTAMSMPLLCTVVSVYPSWLSSPCDCQWSVPPWACPYCAQSCQCIHHGHQVLVTVSDLYHHEHALIVHSRVSVSIMAIKSLWLSVICTAMSMPLLCTVVSVYPSHLTTAPLRTLVITAHTAAVSVCCHRCIIGDSRDTLLQRSVFSLL